MEAFKQTRFKFGRNRAPELAGFALRVAGDPTYDQQEDARRTRQLLFDLIGVDYQSRELFDAIYQLRKRALIERRAQPQAGPQSTVSGPQDLLTKYNVLNMDEPLAELLPLLDDACDGIDLIDFLAARHYEAAFERLRDLYSRSGVTMNQCDGHITALFESLQTAAATDAIAQRVRWLVGQPESASRDLDLDQTVSVLGATRYEAQIDLEALKHDVLQQPMNSDLHEKLNRLLVAQIAIAHRATEFTAENLAYWLGQDPLNPLILFSMPVGAQPDDLLAAVRNFARQQFAD
jgi:hypothetical protein